MINGSETPENDKGAEHGANVPVASDVLSRITPDYTESKMTARDRDKDRDRSRQVNFMADPEVLEFLENCENKTRALNDGIRLLMQRKQIEAGLEERLANVEKVLVKVPAADSVAKLEARVAQLEARMAEFTED